MLLLSILSSVWKSSFCNILAFPIAKSEFFLIIKKYF